MHASDGAPVAARVPDDGARLRRIDALRGIAALLVVWLHVAEAYVRLTPPGGQWLFDFARSVDAGRIGVVAFFLVSGFVIPFSIHPDRPAPIGTFLIKRFFRIYPAYWLSIPFGVLTTWWLWGRAFSGRDLLLNFTLLQDLFGARPAEGLYWTLLVELVFYALCVVLLLTRSLYDMRRIWLVAVAFTFVYSLAMLTRWAGMPLIGSPAAFWFLNLSIMLCGTLYRTCVFDKAAAHDPWLRRAVAALLGYHLLILPAGAVWAVGFERNASVSYALGLLLFVLGVSFVPLASRLTDWLGRISYSIYLFHPVVFLPLLWWLLRQPADSWWRTQHLGIYLLVNIGLTLWLATGVHRYVEQPGIRLGKRCAARWARRAQDRAARGTAAPASALQTEADETPSAA